MTRRWRAEHAFSSKNLSRPAPCAARQPPDRTNLMAGTCTAAPVTFARPQRRELSNRGATLNGDEAPPCMRWRGLALPHRPGRRLLGNLCCVALPRRPGEPIAQLPCAARAPLVPDSRHAVRSPRPCCVPSVSLGADPVFSGERFLLPIESAAQGLSARTSRFFSHPQDICCLSSVHG